MKKLMIFSAIALLAFACGNQGEKNEEATQVNLTEFNQKAPDLLGQLVSIEGTVAHVCKHGGKKLFIGDVRVKVIASEAIAAFDPVLEGSDVVVSGYIREEIIEPVLAENKAETEMPNKGVENTSEAAEEIPAVDVDSVAGEVGNKEDCEFEEVVPLYVIEVKTLTQKQ